MVNREGSIYETRKYIYNFQQFEAIRLFAKNMFADKITLNNADKHQSDLLIQIVDLNKDTNLRRIKRKKRGTYESINVLYNDTEMVLDAFKSEIFPLPSIEVTGIKILTTKQMLQRLPITLEQVKAGNTSLRNEIRQIIYYLYRAKKTTKRYITILRI